MNEKIDVSNQDIQYIKKLMTKNLEDEIHAPHIDPSELSEQSHERHAWQQDPYNRIRFDELFLKLNDLSEKYPIPP
ncbi:8468_t:CDS:2, partial [Dentiscutata erythropus]